ncbi:sialidase family protein [Flindersiella endophytica]
MSSEAGTASGTVVFESGTDGYHTFRIPAIVRTDAGTLVAFAEGRREGAGDAGSIDLVLRRSADGGATWGPLRVVHSDPPHTVGNPAPVVDPASGDIVLLTVRTAGWASEDRILRGEVEAADARRVLLQRGTSDGETWSAPQDITDAVKPADWRWYATGPGHAIALRHGSFAGRLVCPANHSTADGYGGHALLSDDGGRSWRIGAVQPADGTVDANETTAAELPDGRVYFSTRNQARDAPATRAYALSDGGGESFDQPYVPAPGLRTPVVQGSVLAIGSRLAHSGPSDPSARRRMVVRISSDGGLTWRTACVVSEAPAAYSDLVELGGQVGLLYETGVDGPYERICFERIRWT